MPFELNLFYVTKINIFYWEQLKIIQILKFKFEDLCVKALFRLDCYLKLPPKPKLSENFNFKMRKFTLHPKFNCRLHSSHLLFEYNYFGYFSIFVSSLQSSVAVAFSAPVTILFWFHQWYSSVTLSTEVLN